MRTTSPEGTQSGSPPRLQRLVRLGAWCFIVVGATHLLIMAVTVLGPGCRRPARLGRDG